ncbi:NAD(P)/FAD-dependent oxidoreductase [Negadavirga shengliensis]|uniref:Geranylgeranyl reductase family protein n=1 Tax=Negadavirga shengliensis TaxID=1389218 RepID=A0ABV9T0N2_9BACT
MPSFDIVIIGTGPAGAMAAYEASAANLSVAIFEKETLPRYKTCGGGLVYRGRNLLPFDVSQVAEKEFSEIEVHFENSDRCFTASRNAPVITMVMRDKFDALITEKAVEKGAKLIQKCVLEHIGMGSKLELKTTTGLVESDYLIVADGAFSPTARMAGWKESRQLIPALEYEVEVDTGTFEKLSQTVRFDVDTVPYGYAWCFPKRAHLSIGVACFRKSRINLKDYYRYYLEKLGVRQIIKEEAHGFQIPIGARKDGFAKNRVFLAGDAAGFADPLTAEGISNALYSGQLAAKCIHKHFANPSAAVEAYQTTLKNNLLRELKTSGLLSRTFYGQPHVRKMLINKYGQKGCEYLTDIFMGNKTFPHEIGHWLRERLLPFPL